MEIFLLVSGIILNMILTQLYDLKSGPISVEGYFLFSYMANKFYTHFATQAMGVSLAFFYYDVLLPYRRVAKIDQAKAKEEYPKLHGWIVRPWISWLMNLACIGLIVVTLLRNHEANIDAYKWS